MEIFNYYFQTKKTLHSISIHVIIVVSKKALNTSHLKQSGKSSLNDNTTLIKIASNMIYVLRLR